MTGFTLGQSSGTTLGGDSGGTLGVDPGEYRLNNAVLPSYTSEAATHQTLTLGFRVQTKTLLNTLRQAKTDENQIATRTTDDGGFTSIDRANGGNTFTLTPPPERRPLRQAGTYHVARYEEDLVSQTVDEWDVEIEFVPTGNRTDHAEITVAEQDTPEGGADAGATLGESSGFTLGGSSGASLGNTRIDVVPSDWWGFETRNGTIATDRVDAEFIGTGADGVERFELTTRLTFDEAHVFEVALAKLDGVRVRSIPDATNVAVDDTDGANTLTIDSPTEDVLADGAYVVMDFESTRLNDAFQEVAFEVASEG